MNPNEETLAFYFHIGLAITQWANVEHALAGIAVNRFGQNNLVLAAIGFYSIENFRARTQYCDAILRQANIDADRASEWDVLQGRLRTKSQLRNRLAHYWVLHDPSGKPGRRAMLLPKQPPRNPSPGTKFPGAICIRDIIGYRLEFTALANALWNFGARLEGTSEPLPKEFEKVDAPPTVAQIRRELYKYAANPPRS